LFTDIFKNSAGPKTAKEMVTLGCKGFLMGCADTVPGISGGTIAYLTGIYTDLLNAINSIDKTFFAHLKQFELKAAFTHIHTKFFSHFITWYLNSNWQHDSIGCVLLRKLCRFYFFTIFWFYVS